MAQLACEVERLSLALYRFALSRITDVMSLNLSRNAVAMERAMRLLTDAERSLEACSQCLLSEVVVLEAQASVHNCYLQEAIWQQ